MTKENLQRIVFLVAAFVFIWTAYNSHGFYHADEHYQIIEFSGLKLGTHSPNDLAWEYNAQIRPALQPTICFILFKILNSFQVTDPYTQAFILRLISAIFSLFVITYFIRKTEFLVESKAKLPYYLLSYFLWFIPFISVRFSSETWSGLLFVLALGVFFSNSNEKLKPFKIGFLLGLSFLFRFQIAFACIGFFLWLILVDKSKFNYLLKIGIPIILIVFLGIIIDSWFYETLLFTPWNYFYQNILLGTAADFGTSPWYFYLVKLVSYPSFFIGIPIITSFIIFLIFKPKNLFLWCILTFVIFHSFISHKEERFLFPIVFLFPIILIESWQIFNKVITHRLFLRIFNTSLAIVFIFINSIGILAMASKSAGIGRMEISRYIHYKYGHNSINLIFCSWANPYNPWHSLPIKFYSEKNFSDIRIENLCQLNDSLIVKKKGVVNLLVFRKVDLTNENCMEVLKKSGFVFEIQSIPKWIEKISTEYSDFENQDILELYTYKGAQKLNTEIE